MKIEIEKEIIKKLKKRISQTKDFKNLKEYINYILKQVAEKLENKPVQETSSKEDEENVKKRLKALGYLN